MRDRAKSIWEWVELFLSLCLELGRIVFVAPSFVDPWKMEMFDLCTIWLCKRTTTKTDSILGFWFLSRSTKKEKIMFERVTFLLNTVSLFMILQYFVPLLDYSPLIVNSEWLKLEDSFPSGSSSTDCRLFRRNGYSSSWKNNDISSADKLCGSIEGKS